MPLELPFLITLKHSAQVFRILNVLFWAAEMMLVLATSSEIFHQKNFNISLSSSLSSLANISILMLAISSKWNRAKGQPHKSASVLIIRHCNVQLLNVLLRLYFSFCYMEGILLSVWKSFCMNATLEGECWHCAVRSVASCTATFAKLSC